MPSAAPTGRDAEALRSLARRIDPSDPGAQNNLGVFYYERGLIPDAIAAFARALDLDPEMRVAQDNLETVQRESGYYDTRIGALREQPAGEPSARWKWSPPARWPGSVSGGRTTTGGTTTRRSPSSPKRACSTPITPKCITSWASSTATWGTTRRPAPPPGARSPSIPRWAPRSPTC